MATLTVYPDAHPETTSVDGHVYYDNNPGDTWSNVVSHTGSSATANDTEDTGFGAFEIQSSATSNNWQRLHRIFVLFDTSAIGSGSIVSSVTLSIYCSSKGDPLGITPSFGIYTASPASNTGLVANDFDNVGSVAQSDTIISYASFSGAGYNNWAFNATGLGNISLTEVSKFSMRNKNYDVDNVAPTWSSFKTSYLDLVFADKAGTSQDPKLVITYTSGAAAIPAFSVSQPYFTKQVTVTAY